MGGTGRGIPDSIVICKYEQTVRLTTYRQKKWLILEKCDDCPPWYKLRIYNEEQELKMELIKVPMVINLYVSLIIGAPTSECPKKWKW
jgi:hypothetical protein